MSILFHSARKKPADYVGGPRVHKSIAHRPEPFCFRERHVGESAGQKSATLHDPILNVFRVYQHELDVCVREASLVESKECILRNTYVRASLVSEVSACGRAHAVNDDLFSCAFLHELSGIVKDSNDSTLIFRDDAGFTTTESFFKVVGMATSKEVPEDK